MLVLLADIGGTYSRLQLSELSVDSHDKCFYQTYENSRFTHLQSLVMNFLAGAGGERTPQLACIAVAGPVENGVAILTNLPWIVNASLLASECGIADVQLINDVAASAYGITCLSRDDFTLVYPGNENAIGPRLVVNVGTGYGQALLFSEGGNNQALASEGGHTDFAAVDEFSLGLLSYLLKNNDQLTVETLLSGPGLSRLFAYVQGDKISTFSTIVAPATIIDLAKMGDKDAVKTINHFVNLLAHQLVNSALTYVSIGGIYLVGGLSLALKGYLEPGVFTKALSRKPTMNHWLKKIPIKLVLDKNPGLLGTAKIAQNILSQRREIAAR